MKAKLDKLKYETKLKQLEKLETKIEQNLTHIKQFRFFEQNDSYLYVKDRRKI